MKLRFFSIFALAEGLLLSSCAVEEVSVAEHTILAEMETDQTRTSVTDEGGFTWAEGDRVWLHTTSGSVVGTLSSGAGTSRAKFSFDTYIGEMTGNAVYPYNSGHSLSGDSLSMVMPASYDLGSNLTNTNAAMYGVVNSKGILKFRHLAGVMRFKFKGVPAGVNKFTITLDKKINGTFAADLTADYPVIETSSSSTASEKTITLNFNALAANSDISVYVPLPIGTYNSLELGLYDDGQSVWTYSKSVTNTVSRKSLKLMPVVTLGGSVGGEIEGGVADLSANGTANSYIVSSAGSYKFSTVKGNSSTSVGTVSKAEVLWESFGTYVTPNVGDLVKNAVYTDGCITFQTTETFKEGNAVIAAKDASDNILWSWHIWLTDEPEGQEYYNNAGTMMDRNLGATSATPGDVGALGLLYQWGRKDPFLGSSSISNTIAKSTIAWPSAVSSDSSNGTIAYATANPTTFIAYNSNNSDWYYTDSYDTDNTRWTTSESSKSIYDPCPAGWRVPDGGNNGVWSTALGSSSSYDGTFDSTNEGMNFSGKFGSDQTIWYPASGFLYSGGGGLSFVGSVGGCWSSSPDGYYAYGLYFDDDGSVYSSNGYYRARGQAVRCVKEGSQTSGGSQTPDVEQEKPLASSASDLATDGSANSYIVTKSGTYKFKPVKGNSSTSVGSVSKVEVLWETFGTSETPSVGDLIKSVNYDSGYVVFATSSSFKEGNAVIAAKDASGNILWSWHIWLTDQPEGQVYYNNAGTMMDRNLGATSATPGDVGALGLLYQWGRKDPFLCSSSISSSIEAESTIIWPTAVSTSSSTGTVDYVTSHPTTFVTGVPSSDYDWCYSSRDNSLWTTSDKAKSIYDPCPAGWRVPDGGSNGVWSKAGFADKTYDSTNEGMSFSISSPSTTWYPASGDRGLSDRSLSSVGYYGYYWSASPDSCGAYSLSFADYDNVNPSNGYYRARGQAVRCVKEGTGGGSSDSDSNVHKETVRFESVTYDWTLQRALDLRGDNNEPYAKPIINNVRYDNIYNLEYFLRPDSEYQITKTVKCGDQIVDPSVITIQNISPPKAVRAGSADIVLSGYEFGDTESTYSFEILASNDDLELIITGSITLGALPETVEIEREVALMLVPGTTQFEGVEALVADAYEELGVENAGFNEANLAKVNDVMLAVLMDPENVVTNIPDYLTNLNFQVDANVDNSFVRLYNHQVANNILNPDGYVFERTIDTWFGVDFVYTITAKPELPENYLII